MVANVLAQEGSGPDYRPSQEEVELVPVLSGDARSAVFSPVADSLDRGAAVTRRLGAAIALGLVSDGEQLPPEQELAQTLNVAPVTLRRALQDLRDLGLVETRRGRAGGSFVRADEDSLALLSRTRLAELGLHDLRELGDVHVAVIGTAAGLAAERASRREVGRLRQIGHDLARAADDVTLRRLDGRFHIELAAAAQSARLTRMEVELQGELAQLAWQHSRPDPETTSQARLALVTAVEHADAVEARRLAEEQITELTRRLIDGHLALTREQTSQAGPS